MRKVFTTSYPPHHHHHFLNTYTHTNARPRQKEPRGGGQRLYHVPLRGSEVVETRVTIRKNVSVGHAIQLKGRRASLGYRVQQIDSVFCSCVTINVIVCTVPLVQQVFCLQCSTNGRASYFSRAALVVKRNVGERQGEGRQRSQMRGGVYKRRRAQHAGLTRWSSANSDSSSALLEARLRSDIGLSRSDPADISRPTGVLSMPGDTSASEASEWNVTCDEPGCKSLSRFARTSTCATPGCHIMSARRAGGSMLLFLGGHGGCDTQALDCPHLALSVVAVIPPD